MAIAGIVGITLSYYYRPRARQVPVNRNQKRCEYPSLAPLVSVWTAYRNSDSHWHRSVSTSSDRVVSIWPYSVGMPVVAGCNRWFSP